MIVNMSVWETIEDLKNFAFKFGHLEIMRKRNQWFEKHKSAYMVIWWIPKGHIPSTGEAKSRLEYLEEHGESAYAFTFRKAYGANDG